MDSFHSTLQAIKWVFAHDLILSQSFWRHKHKADWKNILKSFSRKEMKKAEAEAEQYRFQQTFEQANNQGGQQGF